jgi:hypothetical protein
MDEYENSQGFSIPKSFLLQLSEYTRGYMLLVCNDKGDLYAHESYDNPVVKLGLANFAEMHIAAVQKHMHNIALKEEERLENNSPESDEDGEGEEGF